MPQIVAVNSKGGRDKEIGPWGPSPSMGVAGPWGYWLCGCRERGFFPIFVFLTDYFNTHRRKQRLHEDKKKGTKKRTNVQFMIMTPVLANLTLIVLETK